MAKARSWAARGKELSAHREERPSAPAQAARRPNPGQASCLRRPGTRPRWLGAAGRAGCRPSPAVRSAPRPTPPPTFRPSVSSIACFLRSLEAWRRCVSASWRRRTASLRVRGSHGGRQERGRKVDPWGGAQSSCPSPVSPCPANAASLTGEGRPATPGARPPPPSWASWQTCASGQAGCPGTWLLTPRWPLATHGRGPGPPRAA